MCIRDRQREALPCDSQPRARKQRASIHRPSVPCLSTLRCSTGRGWAPVRIRRSVRAPLLAACCNHQHII
eukprot:3503596-Prorocentrum_lima.AAC.1